MGKIKSIFFAMPLWYRWVFGALLVCYISAWIFTMHLSAVQKEKGVLVIMPVLANGDSGEYASLSTSILSGQGFKIDGVEEAFRTPGYPSFIALTRLLSGGSYFTTTLLQIFLVFVSGILIWRIGGIIFSSRTGMVASLVYMANSLVFASSLIIMSETLFVFLLVLGVYLSLKMKVDSSWYMPVCIGLIFAFATYVRPIGILALPLYLAPLFILKVPVKRVFLYALVVAVVSIGATVPWMIKNKEVSGVFSFSSLPASNLVFYYISNFMASKEGTSVDYQRQVIEKASGVTFPTQAEDLAYSPTLIDYGTTILKQNFSAYARYHVVTSWPFLFSSYFAAANDIYHRSVGRPVVFQSTWRSLSSGDWRAVAMSFVNPPWKFTDRFFRLTLFSFFLIGLWMHRKSKAMWFCLFSILYLMFLVGPLAQARFALPAIPFIALLAAAGLDIIPQWKKTSLN
ncbi:MAG: glycosyltransferase family 39 protein [Candidatus Zambryskibacteria bacterium]|nr:glycosyltransferase family 39 protein [Candidatus Zambryskibacteria bacterium]